MVLLLISTTHFRYANCGDDENSQAEGTTSEGATGAYSRQTIDRNIPNVNAINIQNHAGHNRHYENIYESIDQFAAAAVPAENIQIAHMVNLSNNNYRSNNRVIYQNSGMRNTSYRNELYDRTSGYDVPRQLMRNNGNYGQNMNMNGPRRPNLNLDLNPNRARFTAASRGHRQHSFDDTESYHYANSNGNNNINGNSNIGYRCENIYEQIHDEPVYRNINIAAGGAPSRHYGRLDVIGHGIGRIERHLSSSCGNIDHYNLGGHYAVLGHSHLGTVGHIRLNAGTAPSNSRETAGKSLNFFSCLGRENSQSMNNIYRASAAPNNNGQEAAAAASIKNSLPEPVVVARPTGAIPKAKNKIAPKSCSPPPMHTTAFNRIPKSSLQWLLVNKWLPLWVGQGPDYNVLDFNFMFSRNCNGCGNESMSSSTRHQQPIRRSAEMPLDYNYRDNGNYMNSDALRILRANQSLPHPREVERCYRRDGSLDDRPRYPRSAPINDRFRSFGNSAADNDHAREIFERNLRRRYEGPQNQQNQHNCSWAMPHGRAMAPNESVTGGDPFRHWELNSEYNTFRPAPVNVRRITDGTFPHNAANNISKARIRIEVTDSLNQPSTSAEAFNRSFQQELGPAAEELKRTVELSPNSSRIDDTENDKSSPESSNNRRFPDNAEEDQSSAMRLSDSIMTSDDDSSSNNEINDDDANTDDDDHSSFGPSDDSKDMTDK